MTFKAKCARCSATDEETTFEYLAEAALWFCSQCFNQYDDPLELLLDSYANH
jgi:hypothetical protein